MDKCTPRYKRDPPAEELPTAPGVPELKILQISEDKLIIPRDVRQAFLSCPIWGPEWRELLKKFDADWGVAIPNPSPAPQPSAGSGPGPVDGAGFWSNYFQEDPKTLEAVKAKYGADITEFAGLDSSSSFLLCPGPVLFIHAKDAVLLRVSDSPLVCHGAGTWLLAEKAEKYLRDHPGKGIPCAWTADSVPVIIEDWAV